jgi:hypothetical protein
MRDVGRSRPKANFDQKADRKIRARRKNELQMHDEFWSLEDQLELLRDEYDYSPKGV